MIDYLQDSAQKLELYLREMQTRRYVYGRHYLPHDAESNRLEGRSIADQMRAVYGDRSVIVAPRTDNVSNDLKVCRTMFATCCFDREKTAEAPRRRMNGRRHQDHPLPFASVQEPHSW